jgi:hexosaminidase
MRHQIIFIFSFIFIFLKTPNLVGQSSVNIIPKPQKVEQLQGVFTLTPKTVLFVSGDMLDKAKRLKQYLEPALGYDLAIVAKPAKKNVIEFSIDKNLKQLGVEGYRLIVTPDKINLTALDEKGIFLGVQTIRQLLPNQINRSAIVKGVEWEIPCVKIEDKPRFKWRGLMLDCSRTFIPKEQVKKYLEAMSYFKMNVLHMHLTDDQGWRLEINKYPELTSVCAKIHDSFKEPKEYEGFYSQDDIRELVEFAAQRNIEIIPEIEMPGHTAEVFAAFPQLSCTGDTLKIHPWTKGAGIRNPVFCAGNEQTFEFIENVLKEVAELFPSTYIHIGGDEATKMYWKACLKCQIRIKDNGLKDENELQSWFVKRIEKYVNSKGKKLIGWDEIMDGGLSSSATVMYWRARNEAVTQKIPVIDNDIVMTPTSHCYFDFTYEKTSTERVYSYDPVPAGMSSDKTKKIMGVQANFWSHLDRTAPRIDQKLFPRIIALAEVAWTDQDKKDWSAFNQRLQSKLSCLDIMGIYYFKEK